ncbi:MAG: GAF domain-containing protein [Roseobacter sp.]
MMGDPPESPSEADALAPCEAEAIRAPDCIQAHGGMIVACENLNRITQVSANIADFLGTSTRKTLGLPLSAVLTPEDEHTLRNALSVGSIHKQREFLGNLTLSGGNAMGAVHVSNGSVVIELSKETAQAEKPFAGLEKLRWFLSRRLEGAAPETALNAIVRNVRAISGFDRVMAYRFRPDGSAEVIAEARSMMMESYLHLRCPSRDIPAIARQICLEQPVRIIADTGADDIPLLALDAHSASVDLTLAELRGTSEVHRTYLLNMGVGASLVLPVVIGGRLWGLFSCHNRTPRFLTTEESITFDLFSRFLNSEVARCLERDQSKLILSAKAVACDAASQDGVSKGALFNEAAWAKLARHLQTGFAAQGAALVCGGKCHASGLVDDPMQLEALCDQLEPQAQTDISCSSALVPDQQRALGAAGVLRVGLGGETGAALWLVRAEENEVTSWAGAPEKTLEQTAAGTDLPPRTSFSVYQQSSRGCSRSWEPEDIALAEAFQSALREALEVRLERNARAQERAATVQRLTERMRNTLAILRGLAESTAREGERMRALTDALAEQVLALADANDLLCGEDHEGSDMEALLRKALGAIAPQRVELSGRPLQLSPSASTIFAVAIDEMVTNAATRSAVTTLSVSWQDQKDGVHFHWGERSDPPIASPETSSFGAFLMLDAVARAVGGSCHIDDLEHGVSIHMKIPQNERISSRPQPDPNEETRDVARSPAKSGFDAVLILEDDFLIASEQRRHLRRNGVARVLMANTNAKAQEKIGAFAPEAAVLDVSLGEEDSLVTAKTLWDMNVPFIFLTGYEPDHAWLNTFQGAPVLKKPIDPAELLPALHLAREAFRKRVNRDEYPAA